MMRVMEVKQGVAPHELGRVEESVAMLLVKALVKQGEAGVIYYATPIATRAKTHNSFKAALKKTQASKKGGKKS